MLGKKSIEFPPDVDPEGRLARSERELFKSRRDKLVEGTQAIQRQIHLAQSQLDLVRPLVAKRAVSQMEALKLSQDIATLSGKLTELKAPISRMPIPSAHSARPISAPWNRSSSSARTSCAAPRSCRRCAGG